MFRNIRIHKTPEDEFSEIIPGLYQSEFPTIPILERMLTVMSGKNQRLVSILAVVEEHEYISRFASPKELLELQKVDKRIAEEFAHRKLPMRDRTGEIALDKLILEVDQIHQILQKPNQAVIVHCREGKGRSTLINVCYLLKYYTLKEGVHLTPDEAYHFLRSKRRIASFTSCRAKAFEFYNFLHPELKLQASKSFQDGLSATWRHRSHTIARTTASSTTEKTGVTEDEVKTHQTSPST
jgi:protein-tyrosine phosphatase